MSTALSRLPLRQLGGYVCASCRRQLRQRALHTTSHLRDSTLKSKHYIARPGEQASPIAGYYEELLSQPLHITASATRQPTTPQPPPKDEREERIAKARLVFGSRLAGPIERRKQIDAKSTTIAGIVVPPRPGEPDNCCMSGCVNCVWDQYRDELEEWAAQSALAREALAKQNAGKTKKRLKQVGTGSMLAADGTPSHVATSMDDDGGGSESNWSMDMGLGKPGTGKGEDLFGGIPVGIREFMKTEKMLKQRHAAEQRAGA